MERRFSSALEVRVERAKGDPVIVGYGAVFYDGTEATEYELWAGLRERVMPTAFDRALKEGQDVRGLFNHDANYILGRTGPGTMKISKDAKGLRYEISPADTDQARTVLSAIDRGDVSGSSFGFRVVEQLWREVGDTDIRELLDLDVFDVGPVVFPAYTGTDVAIRAAGSVDEVRSAYEAWKASHKDVEEVRARLAELGE